MRVVDAEALATVLPYEGLTDALQQAFSQPFETPTRMHHEVRRRGGETPSTLLIMPAWDPSGQVVVKLVNVVPGNSGRGLPAIMGAVLVSDARTGAWSLALDGGELTARRTACASALASRYLSRTDADTLMIVGAGRLARHLICAHAASRPIRNVLVWARRRVEAEKLARWAGERGFNASHVTLEEGARAASIISCATLSERALIRGEWLRPGVHLDLVGAFRPAMREVDGEAVALSEVFVDHLDSARAEAGDLIIAAQERRFDFEAVRADLFRLCSGGHRGRASRTQITLFKSVGHAVEDLCAARMAAKALL